ncbi:MAG: hypothetical protein J5725_04370 [Bacteroidales bacterium]|nr:hypothetical protein [Bacteroidales bacterium]
MTYKEAIKILKDIREPFTYNSNKDSRSALSAIDFAIMSLQEFDRMKLICANEGIIVYKIRGKEE